MKHWIAITTLCGVIAASAVFAADEPAQKPGDKPGPGRHGLVPEHVLQSLNLTAEQQAKYKEINEQFRKEREALRKEHEGQSKDKDSDKGPADKPGPGRELHHKFMEQFRSILTPDQQKKLDAGLAEFREHHKDKPPKADDKDGNEPAK